MGSPLVVPLPPAEDLSYEHHGPPTSSSSYFSSAAPSSTPKYFQNPWPSWRTPSLADAYKAYQLGAALAHPSPNPAGLSRAESTAALLSNDAGSDLYTTSSGKVLRLPRETWLPSSTYVRPTLAEMYADDEEDDWRDPPVKIVSPWWSEMEGRGIKRDKETVTWLGHAGVLVQLPWRGGSEREGMCGVLFDPIFSYRCSPSQYVGPARYLDPPCTVATLPDIHVCCISHDHSDSADDHLDYYTIMDLWKYHEETIHFFVGLGLKEWFTSSGIPSERVTELDWWHETILSFPSAGSSSGPAYAQSADSSDDSSDEEAAIPLPGDGDLTLKVAFTPAQHRTGRGVLDHMTTLWGSWVVGVVTDGDSKRMRGRGMRDWDGFKVFFGGDTGYRYATAPADDLSAICPAFREISDHYSPFSLSLLPLATGSSLPFLRNMFSLSLDQYTLTSSQHCSPADSLEIHRVLRSERSLGVHWGTFCDGHEARGTRVEFGRARRERGVSAVWAGSQVPGGRDADDPAAESDQDGEEGSKGRFVICDIGETLTFP